MRRTNEERKRNKVGFLGAQPNRRPSSQILGQATANIEKKPPALSPPSPVCLLLTDSELPRQLAERNKQRPHTTRKSGLSRKIYVYVISRRYSIRAHRARDIAECPGLDITAAVRL
jgi:hypothetical protein